jgi:pimeloyl-ACP methyl ester carboxylesterase
MPRIRTATLLGMLCIAGCVGTASPGTARRAPASGPPQATISEPPSLETACGSSQGIDAHTFWIQTADHVRLYGVEAGTGSVGIVLAHQARSSLCGWLPYLKTLIDAGMRVVAFDFRGYGESEGGLDSDARLALDKDLAAAVAKIRSDGAAKVVLIGASLGGAASVQNGADLDVEAIVSLSGTRIWPGYGVNHPDALPRITVPFLLMVSRRDPNVPLSEAQEVEAAVGSNDKQLVVCDGRDHGYDLVEYSAQAAKIRA